MNYLTQADLLDLEQSTLAELGPPRFVQIAQRVSWYSVMGRMLQQDKVSLDGGTHIERRLLLDHNHQARMTRLYGLDNGNQTDALAKVQAPWRHTETKWMWDRREMLMNMGNGVKIVDYMESKRVAGMIALAELLEEKFWSRGSSETDEDYIMGVPYWIVKYPSGTTTQGFNGANLTAFPAGPGQLDASTNSRWRNWTAQYAAVTKGDLIRKLRRAHHRTRFVSPIGVQDFRFGRGKDFRIYTNEQTVEAIEELAESQNENLGSDLAPYAGGRATGGTGLGRMDEIVTFKRNPIVGVPYLNDDTDDPIYGMNFEAFTLFLLSGNYLVESDVDSSMQHNVRKRYIDLTWNALCTDRRRQFCLSRDTDNT